MSKLILKEKECKLPEYKTGKELPVLISIYTSNEIDGSKVNYSNDESKTTIILDITVDEKFLIKERNRVFKEIRDMKKTISVVDVTKIVFTSEIIKCILNIASHIICSVDKDNQFKSLPTNKGVLYSQTITNRLSDLLLKSIELNDKLTEIYELSSRKK